MRITREDAVEAIYKVINSGIIDEELETELEETARCIEKEDAGLFLWGAGDDADVLFTAVREDLITPELTAKASAAFEKYRIKEPKG